MTHYNPVVEPQTVFGVLAYVAVTVTLSRILGIDYLMLWPAIWGSGLFADFALL